MATPRKARAGGPTVQEMLSLHRYLMWAGHMRFRFGERLREATTHEQRMEAQFVDPYLPYWCAGMHVVVEGWKRLGLSSANIERLLDGPHLRLLENFRHGVYHFHPEYYDAKFRGFWAQGAEMYGWLDQLWIAIDAFFKEWASARFPEIAVPVFPGWTEAATAGAAKSNEPTLGA
jgi:hypothetical protein